MRVGKKANVVEAKRTRSCVVRLEKVSSPSMKITRSSGVKPRAHVQLHSDEKKNKGPIKKRPLAQGPNASSSSKAVTPNSTQTSKSGTPNTSQPSAKAKDAKDKFKTPLKGKSEQKKSVVIPEATPTIAAGRSRRAIKPNPKYASEDMVTPKMIRNVASNSGTTAKKSSGPPAKQRKPSTSSLDDFFNEDSNDELGTNELEDELDQMYQAIAKDSDSDFSDESKNADKRSKARGRQRKGVQATLTTTSASTPRPASMPRPTSTPRPTPTATHKGQTSQLQLLRKSFAASVNRSIEPKAGIKRGRNDSLVGAGSSDNDADSSGIARKRILLTKSSNVVSDIKKSNSSDINMIVRKTNQQTLNGSKITKLKTDIAAIEESKRSTKFIEKRTLMDGNSVTMKISQQSKFLQTVRSHKNNSTPTSTIPTTTTTSTTRTLITMPIKTQNARGLTVTKQRRSASPAITKPTKPVKEDKPNESIENKSIDPVTLSTTLDDFETMPTFTIVNINDIINKKGDVLISKSDNKSHKTDDSDVTDTELPPEKNKANEYMTGSGRRKGLVTNKVSDAIRSKSPLTTTTKKPTQKILNHTLVTKSSPPTNAALRNKLNSSISPDKPAPRILNSMVAKKTQPVKPMIANFDDSADEDSYQLSLDGYEDMDEDDDEEEDANDTTGAADDGDNDEDIDDSFVVGKHKLPTSTPYPTKKPTPPSTKENSHTALNRQPTKNIEHRKTTPEKVVISRQGDKVIKKITCFETWFVIIPEETKPPTLTRNTLEMPLIKLANVATHIKLPNDDWKSKVTLHELSPTMIAKSNLTTYTGDLREYNIAESDRGRYQPSCVMFRRSVNDRSKSRLPYDRAVILKNRTFFTNIEGKNVKLVGAPSTINSQKDVEILLQIVDSLTLQSTFVEPTNTMQ